MENRAGRLKLGFAVLGDALVRAWPPYWRRGALAAAGIVVGGLVWAMTGSGDPTARMPEHEAGGTVVVARPLVQRLSLVGTVEAGSVVNLASPFDGAIREKLVEYGSRVERGQAMLVLDTTDIELQTREAEAAAIKASRAVEDLKSWGNSPDVMRARRAVIGAQMTYDELARKERESKALLARGIIPRVEYDGIAEQLKSQELQVTAARQDLGAVLERGNAENRRLATLELKTARKRLAELKRQMDGGLIEAPVAGLLLRPATPSGGGGSNPASVDVGSRVGKGQPLFTIADTQTLNILTRVDELDVNRLAEGQAVEVVGDAFGSGPMTGQVVRISAQAASGSSVGSRGATFDVMVVVNNIADEQRRRIRMGMSATVSIVTYENPLATVVPASAVRSGDGGTFVMVRDPVSGNPRTVPVVIGRSTEDGVEIIDGLQDGDVVVGESRTNM